MFTGQHRFGIPVFLFPKDFTNPVQECYNNLQYLEKLKQVPFMNLLSCLSWLASAILLYKLVEYASLNEQYLEQTEAIPVKVEDEYR
ncbi:MAG: hypothetical protein LVT47_05160 [Cyanobacteria bacterium LVE1205-1]|jgi:uncharacterized membrane protein